MSSVDDRIVNMQFNNRQFSAGVTDSQRSLASLEQSLARAGSGTGAGLSNMAASVEATTSRFGALKVAGISAIATIASKATTLGLGLVKSLTLDPITAGFTEYTTNLNSIQTIMANTGASVDRTNHFLQLLNTYSDKTIYNFSQMASAIGKFTAAGVSLPDATDAIRGMANSAALSGASVDQLNSAMYQMSQALAAGTIKLMDWNSLVNANMGGENMQESLKATAMTMDDAGRAMTDATTTAGNFRDSLQAGWLTADIFNKTMKVMGGQTVPQGDKALKLLDMTQKEFNKSGLAAGDIVAYTTDQLVKMGYSDEAAKRLHELSDSAIHSAQDIKSIPQLIDVVRESIGSGFGRVFQDLFGNFEESKKLWTGVGTSITGAIGNIFAEVDKVLLKWKALGGYADLWIGIGNIFRIIGNLLHPVLAAFEAISPSTKSAGSSLADLTHNFRLFTELLLKGSEAVDSFLTPIFVQFGTVIGFVFHQISQLAKVAQLLAPAFAQIGKSISGFADIGRGIATDLLGGFIEGLNADAIKAYVVGFAQSIIDWIKSALGISSPSVIMADIGKDLIAGLIQGIGDAVPLIIDAFAHVVNAIFSGIGTLFEGISPTDLASLINAVIAGGLLLALKNMVKSISNMAGTLDRIVTSFTGFIDQVGNSLKAWQNALKAKMIKDIAIAIGILVASLVLLALLDPKQLAIGMGAIATLLGLLSTTLLVLGKIDAKGSLSAIGLSILLISTAMLQFAAAVAILGNMDIMTLAKGIGAIALVMGIMVVALRGLSGISGSLVPAAAAMVLMAFALNILAGAVFTLGSMDLSTLAKGLGAIAIGLALMTASLAVLSVVGKNAVKSAAALILVAVALNLMAAAVLAFGSMDPGTLAQGFIAMGIGLGIMVAALLLLSGIGPAVLAAGGAMIAMAIALNILLSVILVLGVTPWSVIIQGITAVAIALGVLIAAGALAEAVAPGLLALSVVILALGAAMFLAGVGMSAFATGYALLAATGVAGTVVLVAAIHALLALLPEIAVQVAAAFIAFITVIANATGPIREAFDKIFKNIVGVITDNIPVLGKLISRLVAELLRIITQSIPKWGKLFSALIKAGLDILTKAVPQYVKAGTTIILKILQGMENNIPKIVNTAGDLIVKFIQALGNQANRIIDAAGKTILQFLDGLDRAINKYEDKIIAKGVDIALDIGKGVVKGLLGGDVMGMVRSAAENLANALPGWMRKVLGIDSPSKVAADIGHAVGEGLAKGISESTGKAIAAVIKMANDVIAAGNKAVLHAQRHARRLQSHAYLLSAQADLKADRAQEAARAARQRQKDRDAKARAAQHYADQHKQDKAAQARAKKLQKQSDVSEKQANKLQKQADAAQKRADKAQKQADRAAQHVEDVRAFQEADLHGKGDIRNDQAVALADRADQVMQKANAEAERARELMKTNHKAGRALLKQAEKDAKRARELAKQARQAHKDANKFYEREVDDRIKQLEKDAAADEKAKKDQEAYDAADAQGKSDILTKRAEASEARAKEQKALAEKLMHQAKRLAGKDAAKAMKLLDRAEKASQAAKDAADQATQEREQAESVLNEGSTGGTGGTGATIEPSRSVLEDAAKAVDRYTESLLFASQAAAAAQGTIQFNQNNYSPEALSASEVYRQSKNLLSSAELKMGARTSI